MSLTRSRAIWRRAVGRCLKWQLATTAEILLKKQLIYQSRFAHGPVTALSDQNSSGRRALGPRGPFCEECLLVGKWPRDRIEWCRFVMRHEQRNLRASFSPRPGVTHPLTSMLPRCRGSCYVWRQREETTSRSQSLDRRLGPLETQLLNAPGSSHKCISPRNPYV